MAVFGLGRARRASAEMERLYGRDEALTLAAALLERPKRAERRARGEPPVLLFTGLGGSGKTALLDGLESRLDQCVPYARIDCAPASGASVPDLLMALAFGLNRRRGPSGRLSFPRLLVGQLVMRHQRLAGGLPVGGDGDAARAEVKRLFLEVAADNEAAIACYSKLGFRAIGRMHRSERDATGQGWHDQLLMELVATDPDSDI